MSFCRQCSSVSSETSSNTGCSSKPISVRKSKKSRPCLPNDANSGCPVCDKSASSPPFKSCAASITLPQYWPLGLSANTNTSQCSEIFCKSCKYIGAIVEMPNTKNRSGRCALSKDDSSFSHSATRCGADWLPSSKYRQSCACQTSSSPSPRSLPSCQASIHCGRYTRYWSKISANCPAN